MTINSPINQINMKRKLLLGILTAASLLCFPDVNFSQAPNLGTAASFELFTSVGAVSNTGISQVTGNVGTNSGSSTSFGNVNGVMHDNDAASAQCKADLQLAYNQLNATVATFFPAPLLGNGQTLNAGVYSISGAATLNLGLTLDGQGNPNAVFIFKIQGPLSTNALSKVHLKNGALACNVFWKVEGLVSMATGTTMRGTIIANNAAINMNSGDTLEGRALSTSGAVTIDGVLAYTPIGCGSPYLTGPAGPALASAGCYGIFTSIGPVTNTAITHVTGDVGSNNGLTTGFNPLFVTGTIHSVPDGSTAACSTDLIAAYNYLNGLPYDIELLYPAQFGRNLVLTPHIYILKGATTFTDTLLLNAEGNANAVFVIQINGALNTSVNARVRLINGTQAKNVFWSVNGAVGIASNSIFIGTIVSNNGAISTSIGDTIDGRLLSTNGAINTTSTTVNMPPGCGNSPFVVTEPVNQTACSGGSASFSVSATGSSLTYQWRKGAVNLINGGNISGATTAVLTINPVTILDTSSFYNVIVNGAYAPADTSIFVSLKINTAAVITSQPSNQTTCAGSSASFSVTASGGSLTYQWRKGLVNLVNGGNISGANSAVLIINPVGVLDTASNYNVVITGSCGGNVTSANAKLSISPPPVMNSVPNQVVCNNSPTATITFSGGGAGTVYSWSNSNTTIGLAATGSGNIPSFTASNSGAIADSAIITVTPNLGCNGPSKTFTIKVNPSPVANAGGNSPVCSGSSINLNAQTVIGATYSWTGPAAYTSSLQNPSISPATSVNAGTYTLTVISGMGCSSAPSTVSVVIQTCAITDLSILKTVDNTHPIIGHNVVFTLTVTNNGPDNATGVAVTDILQSGYSYVSSSTAVGSYDPSTGVWAIGNLSNGSVVTLTITVTVVAPGNYSNTAIVYGNETDGNTVNNISSVITYPSDFNIPEGFSPNGDGINDLFVIRGIDNFQQNTFAVFNRWGDKVFGASNYQNTWDGRSSGGLKMGGDELPVGTYFYTLDLGNGSKVYTGSIYLNK
jgi:gliding motility-associated-like protein/uncharacterized repeat protein (TIGR01451 family)